MDTIGLKYLRLSGSTLVEILIAFTVLLLCVSMAAMIITGVARSQGSFDYLEAWITIQNMAGETINNDDLTESEFVHSHFRVLRTLEPSLFTPSVFILEFRVIDQGNKVRLRYKSLILSNDKRHP